MKNIEELAIQNYKNNLLFLENTHPDVYKKIQLLEAAIDMGEYQEKYALEYMQENYFDVKDIASGNFLYASNSVEISKQLTNMVNFKKDNHIFDGFQLYYGFENIENQPDKNKSLIGIYPIMTYYIDNVKPDLEMIKIEKFIFIGCGLSLHLELIDKKIDSDEYLIIEDDLELFKLSLFTTQYYKFLEEKSVIFSIAEGDSIFSNKFNKFLNDSFYINKFLKYSYFPAHSEQKIKLIKNVLSSQDFVNFGYRTVLEKFIRPLKYIKEKRKFLNLSQHLKKSVFSEKPILLLSSGPSLQENIKWIHEHQGKFIVVCVASALKTLCKNNIIPDIIMQIDGFDIAVNVLKGFDTKEFVKDSIAIFGPFVQSDFMKYFNKKLSYITEEDTYYIDGCKSPMGSCVGSTSLYYNLIFNTKKIFLIGLDLALNDEGKSHSKEHVTKAQIDISDTKLDSEISFRKNFFSVKGNKKDIVNTTALFHNSIRHIFDSLTVLKHDDQEIFNLGDGAYLNKTTPLNIEDIKINNLPTLQKDSIRDEILTLFNSYSTTSLSPKDIVSLQKRLKHTRDVQKIISKYKKNVNYTSADSYLYDFFGIISELCSFKGREYSNLSDVYYSFFRYTSPMMTDMLNTKDMKKISFHTKKLDKMISNELINIAKIYENALGDFLK